MMSVNRTLHIDQGSDWSWSFILTMDGLPIEDGWTVHAEIRDTPKGLVLHSFSGGTATLIDGILTLSVDADVSAGFNWRSGVFDLDISKADQKIRVGSGAVFVRQAVSS